MNKPLAYRMRPKTLKEVVGQDHLFKSTSPLMKMIEKKRLPSLILFGPPGVGKTSIAYALANDLETECRFYNAAVDNKKTLESYILEGQLYNGIIIIIDEIHRLNKDKQDILLPSIEEGTITIIGATTTNPYHSINKAIRSRVMLLELLPLDNESITKKINEAIVREDGLNNTVSITEDALKLLIDSSAGDLRFALNSLELLSFVDEKITKETIKNELSNINVISDKDDDVHYDLLSALQKSIRGSDPNAAIYYLARLIQVGDLLNLERRLLVTAYEDVGLANPQAVDRVIGALNSAKIVGFPEASIILAFAVLDLALSPKSKSACLAINKALETVEERSYDVPKYLRLSPHNLDNDMKYPYDIPELWKYIQYLPNELRNEKFYQPNTTGNYEKNLTSYYQELLKIVRSNDLKALRSDKFKK